MASSRDCRATRDPPLNDWRWVKQLQPACIAVEEQHEYFALSRTPHPLHVVAEAQINPWLALTLRPSLAAGGSSCADPEQVEVQFYVSKLSTLDPHTSTFQAEGYLRLWWTDHRLAFNNDTCRPAISTPDLHMDEIWYPDLYWETATEESLGEDDAGRVLRIDGAGGVMMSRRARPQRRAEQVESMDTQYDRSQVPGVRGGGPSRHAGACQTKPSRAPSLSHERALRLRAHDAPLAVVDLVSWFVSCGGLGPALDLAARHVPSSFGADDDRFGLGLG